MEYILLHLAILILLSLSGSNSEFLKNKECTCDVKYTHVGYVSYMRLTPTVTTEYYTYSCLDFTSFFRCTAYRLVRIEKQVKVYKKKYFLAVKQVPCCCEGYEELESEMCRPQCTEPCQNGGNCTGPDTCSCAEGWTGKDCNTDVDECSSETPPCQQKCDNRNGTYSCSCHPGFYQQPDNPNNCVPHRARIDRLRVKARDMGYLTVHWKIATSLGHNELLRALQLNYTYQSNEETFERSIYVVPTESQVALPLLYPGTPVHFKLSLIYMSHLLQENQPTTSGITQVHFRVPDPCMESCLSYYNLEQFINNRIHANSTYTPNPCPEETECIDQPTAPYYFCQ